MVFRYLLFVSNTLYGSKIDKKREFLKKITLSDFIWILKILKPDRACRAVRHHWQKKKNWKYVFTFWNCSSYLSKNIANHVFERAKFLYKYWTVSLPAANEVFTAKRKSIDAKAFPQFFIFVFCSENTNISYIDQKNKMLWRIERDSSKTPKTIKWM